eukprot:1182833-Prorocentrum_minimum.AAC.2
MGQGCECAHHPTHIRSTLREVVFNATQAHVRQLDGRTTMVRLLASWTLQHHWAVAALMPQPQAVHVDERRRASTGARTHELIQVVMPALEANITHPVLRTTARIRDGGI